MIKNYYKSKIFSNLKEDSIQYKVLSAYIKYNKGGVNKLNYLDKPKGGKRKHPLCEQISADIKLLNGDKNGISGQTLWELFYGKNKSLQKGKQSNLINYVKEVDRILKIRDFKEKVLLKIKSSLEKNEILNDQNFVDTLIEKLKLDLKNIPFNLKRDLTKLFLEQNKEHEITSDTLEVLNTFLKKDKNNKRLIALYIFLGVFLIVFLFLKFKKYRNYYDEIIPQNPCRFEPDSTKNKILILPFKHIEGDKWVEDKGYHIERRLDSLNKKDSLNLEIKFCRNIKPKNYEKSYYQELMKANNANHIIYGFIDKDDDCNGDKVCFNYITDYKNISEKEDTNRRISNFKPVTNLQLSQGSLQEKMESLIYRNIILLLINDEQYKKAQDYISKYLMIEKNDEKESDMLALMAYIHRILGLDSRAVISYQFSLSINKQNNIARARYAELLANNRLYKEAEKQFFKAINSLSYLEFDWIYHWYFCITINETMATEIFHLERWVKDFKKIYHKNSSSINKNKLARLIHLLGISKKELGDIQGYNNELNYIKQYLRGIDIQAIKKENDKIYSFYKFKCFTYSNYRIHNLVKSYNANDSVKTNLYLKEIRTFDYDGLFTPKLNKITKQFDSPMHEIYIDCLYKTLNSSLNKKRKLHYMTLFDTLWKIKPYSLGILKNNEIKK